MNLSNSQSQMTSSESQFKKIKLEESLSAQDVSSNCDSSVNAVPSSTGCWPDTVVDWPLESFAENLCQDLFSQKWEVRHGAATALRELIRLHGKGGQFYLLINYIL